MTASSSGAPPWAILCWVDDLAIYTEVPATSGPPLIQKYPLHEGGLTKALNFLRDFHRAQQPSGGTFAILNNANINRGKPGILNTTPAQRESVRQTLRKAGILK